MQLSEFAKTKRAWLYRLPNSLYFRALLVSPEKGGYYTSVSSYVLVSFGIFRLKLAHLESHYQRCQAANNSQDAEDEWQGERGNESVGQQEYAEQDAQDTQDASSPACALEGLDQADDADRDPEETENPNHNRWDEERSPQRILDDGNTG